MTQLSLEAKPLCREKFSNQSLKRSKSTQQRKNNLDLNPHFEV